MSQNACSPLPAWVMYISHFNRFARSHSPRLFVFCPATLGAARRQVTDSVCQVVPPVFDESFECAPERPGAGTVEEHVHCVVAVVEHLQGLLPQDGRPGKHVDVVSQVDDGDVDSQGVTERQE